MNFSVEIRRTSPYNELRLVSDDGYLGLVPTAGALAVAFRKDGDDPAVFVLQVDEDIVERLAPLPGEPKRMHCRCGASWPGPRSSCFQCGAEGRPQ